MHIAGMKSSMNVGSCSVRGLLIFTLGLLILLPIPIAFAQTPAASGRRTTPRRSAQANIDDRVRRLATSLDLNERQQAAVKKILEERQLETLRLRGDPSISGSGRIEQFRALQDTTVKRIRAVLNEEQRKKYDPLASRTIPPAPQPSVEDWLKATTPR
jgi:hypothetical protein